MLLRDRMLMLSRNVTPLTRMAMAACALDLVTSVQMKTAAPSQQNDAIEEYQALVRQTTTAYLSPLTSLVNSRWLIPDTFRLKSIARNGQPPHA